MSDAYTCVYCLKIKVPEEFGREHVLNDAFGRYEPAAFVLLHPRKNIFRVCKDCNNTFGKTIDDALATTTIEGIQRFLFDIKSHKDFATQRYTRNQKIHISTGILKDLEVIPVFSPQRNKIVQIPAKADVGLRKTDGSYDFYPIGELPLNEIAESKYPLHPKRVLILLIEDEASVVAALKDKWDVESLQYEVYDNSNDEDVERISTYTKDTFRSIAKIAFNYLVYFNEANVVLRQCFDPIRNFISEGIGEIQEYVKIVRTPPLYEENGKAVHGHIVALEILPDSSIEASVSLFNFMHYRVKIADNYLGIPINLGFGHFFDPFNKKIYALGRTSIVPASSMNALQLAKPPKLWLPPPCIWG